MDGTVLCANTSTADETSGFSTVSADKKLFSAFLYVQLDVPAEVISTSIPVNLNKTDVRATAAAFFESGPSP